MDFEQLPGIGQQHRKLPVYSKRSLEARPMNPYTWLKNWLWRKSVAVAVEALQEADNLRATRQQGKSHQPPLKPQGTLPDAIPARSIRERPKRA